MSEGPQWDRSTPTLGSSGWCRSCGAAPMIFQGNEKHTTRDDLKISVWACPLCNYRKELTLYA